MLNLRAYPPAGLPLAIAPFFFGVRGARFPLPPDASAAIPFRSGSEALFQVLTTLRATSERHHAGIIALPAYCCPRVLGAVLGAGWTPALVDLIPDGLAMELAGVASALDQGASAVLSVDLFGISTLSEGLRTACGRGRATLIRDMAQCSLDDVSRHELAAEIGILSFGRGKPTSVLTGGALLTNEEAINLARTIVCDTTAVTFSAFLGGLRVMAYDFAIQPVTYGLVRRMPLLHLGESRLVFTTEAQRLPNDFLSLVACQVPSGAKRAELRRATAEMFELIERGSARVLSAAKTAPESMMLSRIPALASDADAAQLVRARAAHFGVTRMYERTLSEFQDHTADEAAQRYPNAFALSRRLLTFPIGARRSPTADREFHTLVG
jgi:hypothetical protein